MKRLLIFTGLILAVGMVNSASAGFMTGFVGNTVFGLDASGSSATIGDGNVNFAVYDNSGDPDSDWTNNAEFSGLTFGVGGVAAPGAKAIASPYIYFYQVVNTDPNPPESAGGVSEDIDSFFVPIFSKSNTTGAGGFTGIVFDQKDFDGGGSETHTGTGPAGNRQLGTEALGTVDTHGDGSPTETGDFLDSSAFVADAGVFNATSVNLSTLTLPGGTTVASAEYAFLKDNGSGVFVGLAPGDYSNVLWFTSELPPIYAPGHLSDGGNTFGDIPTVPAPAGLVLLLTGLPGLAGFGLIKRRKTAVNCS